MLIIAVCDDEAIVCSHLAGKIKMILEELNIPSTIQQFYSGQELLRSPDNFDIIFLDILMPGLDGMKTARLFRQRSFDKLLVFISSSREYVFDAYDVEAFHYLVKPIDEKKLKYILQKAVRKAASHSSEFIIVSRERQNKKLFLDDITYFEIRGRIIEAHGPKGIFSFYEQISVLEKTLQEKGFFRCHKSYLINLKYVASYNKQEVILDQGERIFIARRRYEAFCKAILSYMKKSGGIDII